MKMYDSRKPFKSADFGHVKRELGVLVSLPFEHHGKPGHQRYVEVSYETPTVNTATYAKLAVLEHHWRPEAIAQTKCIINVRTDPKENVWPMVQAGKGISEMLLGSEDL